MAKIRIIVRLDVKNNYVVKGIQLEGLRKVGRPEELAEQYYRAGADEILYMDCVASLYQRNSLLDIVKNTSKSSFIPLTVGGGIRKIQDITDLLHAGADKVGINTAAVKRPEFISEAAAVFGSQCVVGSIEAKQDGGGWQAYIDNGREPTGLEVVGWAKRLEELGAGEILITSVDADGTKQGFDLALVKQVSQAVSIPVVVSGGAGNTAHIGEVLETSGVEAVALASVLHYGILSIPEIKDFLYRDGFPIRVPV